MAATTHRPQPSDPPPKHYQWNFAMGLLHGVSFSVAMAFAEPFSVLPVFLEAFGISRIMIGLLISVIKAGSALPQLLVADRLRRLRSGKPILIPAIWGRWAAWILLSLSVFLWGTTRSNTVLISFVVLLFLFSFAGGVANVPFFNMVAKAIPANRRGRFFGLRQFWGGIAAFGAGWVVHWVLGRPSLSFPDNYGYLFFLTAAVLTVGYGALTAFREPEHDPEPPRAQDSRRPSALSSITSALSEYPALRTLVVTQVASRSLLIVLPFYVLYAKQGLHFPASWVGYFVMAQMLGGVVSNFLWAWLSDHHGNRVVIRLSILIALLTPLLATLTHSFSLYVLVFVLAGFSWNGSNIGYNNYVMELGGAAQRPRLLSVQGTLLFPVHFYPLLGGLLIKTAGFLFTFYATAGVLSLSLLASLFLCEPRGSDGTGCSRVGAEG